jgi:hypothetical protein
VLEISSASGDIKTDLPVAVRSVTGKKFIGEFGGGGVRVSLSSVTGDVLVARF